MKHLLLALALVLWGTSSTPGQDPASSSTRARPNDLKQLLDWVDLEHGLSETKRAEAIEIIGKHRTQATRFSDAGFYMELRRIVALADNGHSNVSGRAIHHEFGVLPLRAYWFSDGLHIVRAKREHQSLLGARITGIDGMPLAQLDASLMEYHGGTGPFFHRYTAPGLMLCPALLQAVGLSQSATKLELQLTLTSGEERLVTIAVDPESSSVTARPWRYLVPASIAGEKDWVSVRDGSSKVPLYLQEEEETFRYIPVRDGEFIYIQLRANIAPGDGIEQFVKRSAERLKDDMPHSIIFDNRQNGGGDLSRTAKFALSLPDLAFDEGKVFVITDGGTFSAGIYSAFYPKAADSKRTLIVGEPVGDRTRFWAETGNRFRLKESGYAIGYSLQIHDLGEGCKDAKLCHMMRYPAAWNIAVGTFTPDWSIGTTFADFAAGKDPQMERILEEGFGQD